MKLIPSGKRLASQDQTTYTSAESIVITEMPLDEFRKKHPVECSELMHRMSIYSFEKIKLKVCGINILKVYVIGNRRYYYCLIDDNINTIARDNVWSKKARSKDVKRYLLTVALCEPVIIDWPSRPIAQTMNDVALLGSATQQDDRLSDYMDYVVEIKDRCAYLGLISMERGRAIKALITIFLYSIGKLPNIDTTRIVVPAQDADFLHALSVLGFTIQEERGGCYDLVKSITCLLLFLQFCI